MKRMKIFDKIIELGTRCWALGFVRGGLPSIMDGEHFECDWVKMPKGRWFADPFILDVTDDEILLLVEDYAYATKKGVISLLHIDRATMEITSHKVLLELPTHLSFPAIWRKDDHIYVYPESAKSGKLDMYEFHTETETLTFVQTICDDVVWDSYITEAFGNPLLFTASKNDYQLDIYKWDENKKRFVPDIVIPSTIPNSRMGGAVFEYKGDYCYPAQNCEKVYGGSIIVKKINYSNGQFELSTMNHIASPHPNYQLGLHTMNEYKGVVVIDVHGYKYGWKGAMIAWLVAIKKKIKGFTSK